MDYHGLNEVMPPLGAAVWDKLELNMNRSQRWPSSMAQMILPKHFSLSL